MTSTETLSVAYDDVHHPLHYNSHPSGVEIKEITGEMACPHLGNAVKYICRYEYKGNPIQDLEKAAEYVVFERTRRIDPRRAYTSPLFFGHPVYRPEYAPFYRYIAAEPNYAMRELLIKIWNADKMDGDDAIELLNSAHDRLTSMIDSLRRSEEREAARKVAETVRRDQAEAAQSFREKVEYRQRADEAEAAAAHQKLTEIQRPEPEPERVEIRDRAAKLLPYITEGDEILLPVSAGRTENVIRTWSKIEVVMRSDGQWQVETAHGTFDVHGNRHITVLMDKERIS